MKRLLLILPLVLIASSALRAQTETPCNARELEVAYAQIREDAILEKDMQLQIKRLQAEIVALKEKKEK